MRQTTHRVHMARRDSTHIGETAYIRGSANPTVDRTHRTYSRRRATSDMPERLAELRCRQWCGCKRLGGRSGAGLERECDGGSTFPSRLRSEAELETTCARVCAPAPKTILGRAKDTAQPTNATRRRSAHALLACFSLSDRACSLGRYASRCSPRCWACRQR